MRTKENGGKSSEDDAGDQTVSPTGPSKSLAAMNELEELQLPMNFMNNWSVWPTHQAMAEAHRRMLSAG